MSILCFISSVFVLGYTHSCMESVLLRCWSAVSSNDKVNNRSLAAFCSWFLSFYSIIWSRKILWAVHISAQDLKNLFLIKQEGGRKTLGFSHSQYFGVVYFKEECGKAIHDVLSSLFRNKVNILSFLLYTFVWFIMFMIHQYCCTCISK